MPRPYASGVINAPVHTVWNTLKDFGNLASIASAVDHSELIADGGVGAVRRLTLGDGASFDERLLALDDLATTLIYEFAGANPFGVRRYVATVRVAPVTDTGGSFVEWWAEFDADAAAEQDLVPLFSNGVFGDGIAGLRRLLTASPEGK
jgi:hypothetical protein